MQNKENKGLGKQQEQGLNRQSGSTQGNLNQRDRQRQQGGQSREPNLEKNKNIQPQHQVD